MGYHENPELKKFFNSGLHKRVAGARGARFMSLKVNMAAFVSTFAFVALLMRLDDPPLYRAPEPPVAAPPAPGRKSLSFVATAEMPHLKRLEVELEPPPHIPKKQYFRGTD
jgi:hypothetical protein